MARDPHLRARSADRNDAISAIQSAYAQGLIGEADRTLRVANARQATTLGELDLLIRDLAAADGAASSPPSHPYAPAADGEQWPTYSPPAQPPPTNVSRPYAGSTPRGSAPTAKTGGLVAVAMLVILASASGMIVNFRADSGSDGIGFAEPEFGQPDFGDPDFGDPDLGEPGLDDGSYELSAPGVDAFIGLLESELGTTVVMRAVFYPEYVSVDVPMDDGERRQQSWLYRDGTFTQLGEPRASTAGDQAVDLRELSLDGLQVSLDSAVHTLGVESPTTTYAIVSHTWAEDQDTVAVHVANDLTESAHLTADFEGTELRRFPFGR